MTVWNRVRPWLGLVVRLGLGAVWLVAAWDKVQAPRTFVQAVRAYDATPEWLSKAIGYGLPVLELAVGVLLVLGLTTRITAIVAGALFAVFLVGILQAAARGLKLDCGCFGGGGTTDGSTTYTLDILRDLGLLALAVYLIVWPATAWGVDAFLSRNDDVAQPSAKRLNSDKGRAKYNAMLEARRREARSRTLWVNASVSVIVVLVAIIGIGVQSGRAKIAGSLEATNATPAQGVTYGTKAPATVDLYEDFQCPNCLHFEESAQQVVDAAVQANKAQVHFHTMAFLDGSSNGNRYSSRAANAGVCASDISVATFVKFHNYLFQASVQPTEGSNGRTDDELISYGQKAGISGASLDTFRTCVTTEQHKALVEAITDQASQQGVTGTPTVKVNGKVVDSTAAAFTKAVDAAVASSSLKPTPSPTAPASPSSSAPSGSAVVPSKSATPSSSTPSSSTKSAGSNG